MATIHSSFFYQKEKEKKRSRHPWRSAWPLRAPSKKTLYLNLFLSIIFNLFAKSWLFLLTSANFCKKKGGIHGSCFETWLLWLLRVHFWMAYYQIQFECNFSPLWKFWLTSATLYEKRHSWWPFWKMAGMAIEGAICNGPISLLLNVISYLFAKSRWLSLLILVNLFENIAFMAAILKNGCHDRWGRNFRWPNIEICFKCHFPFKKPTFHWLFLLKFKWKSDTYGAH